MSSVVFFDQNPPAENEVSAETPLHLSLQRAPIRHTRPNGAADVSLTERAFYGHLILRGSATQLRDAVQAVLGVALPEAPLTVAYNGSTSVQWLSPDEWLIIVSPGEEFGVERDLRAKLGEGSYAVVNVSGGQTLVVLSGPRAREVLMKSTHYDVHPRAFPVGKAVTTNLSKATMMLRRADEDSWELVIRRSFADYIFRWLLDAGAEYGIVVGGARS